MKISLVQFAPELFKAEKNKNYIIEKIKSVNSEIIVFPELAVSGYFYLDSNDISDFSQTLDSEFIKELENLSSELNKIVVLGFAEKTGDKIYNSAIALFPDKSYNKVYRKTHLFYRERDVFEQGDSGYFVIDYKPLDIRIGLMICYDWRFPEASRCLGLLGADLIVCPSNLVTPAWPLVMPARAIENKVYVAVANRIGREDRNCERLTFTGKSAIYSYNGECLVMASSANEEVVTTDIYPLETRNKYFNEVNHLFEDRRPEFYSIITDK